MNKLISKYWLVLMALVSVTMFTACSSDDDDAVTPVFPQVQTIAGNAGDVKEFSFDANENWSLSSNKIWCQITKSDAEEGTKSGYVLNGTAGKQTIKVTLTDDEESKELSVAQLNLKMGGQEVAIAEIHRSAAGYELKVYDEAGNDISETGIVAGYDEYTKFSVKANYRFAATNMPNWVELDGGFLVGRPNETVSSGAMFKEGVKNAKYAISKSEGEYVTFASEDGKAEISVPVIYNGMPTSTMDVTYPTSSPWADWTVSLDGKTFSQTGSTGLTGNETANTFTFSNFVPFTLKTAGDDFTLVVFQKQSYGLEAVYERFVKATGENGDIRLSVDALASGERECYVYALPTAEYEALGNPEKMIDEEDANAVSWRYNKYFLMHFTQKDAKKDNGGETTDKEPIVTIGGYQNVDCKKETTGMYKEVCSEYLGYDGDQIYVATASIGNYVSVNPNIDGWDPTTMMETGYLKTLDMSGEAFEVEPGMDMNDNWVFSFSLSENAPAFLAFQDNGKVVKVVVITPPYDSYSKKHISSIRKIRK